MYPEIISWNVNGFRSQHRDILLLLEKYVPKVLVLQETLLKDQNVTAINGYKGFGFSAAPKDTGVTGGLAFFIHNNVLFSPVNLSTHLQAIAFRVTLHKTITICNLYFPPTSQISENEIENLIEQLPRPFLLVGDFNAHSPLWGSPSTSHRGQIIENIISTYANNNR